MRKGNPPNLRKLTLTLSALKKHDIPVKADYRSPEREFCKEVEGDTLIFGDQSHFCSKKYWLNIIRHIENDIINFLSKGHNIPIETYAVNFALTAPIQKKSQKQNQRNRRIDETNQVIRLCYNGLSSEDIKPSTKPSLSYLHNDLSVYQETITKHVTVLTRLVITIFLRATIGPIEYLQITDENIKPGYVAHLMKLAEKTIDEVVLESSRHIAEQVIANLSTMSDKTRSQLFRIKLPQNYLPSCDEEDTSKVEL